MRKFKHKQTGNIAIETHSEKNYRVSEPQNFTIPKWIVENSEEWEEVKEEKYPKVLECTTYTVTPVVQSKIVKVAKNKDTAFKIGDKTNKGVIEKFEYYEDSILAIIKGISYGLSSLEHYKEVFPRIYSFRNSSKEIAKINKDGNFDYIYGGCKNIPIANMLEHLKGEIYQIQTSETEILTIGDKCIDMRNERSGNFTILGFEYEPSPHDKEVHSGVITVLHDHKTLGKWLDLTKVKKLTKLFTTEDNVDIMEGDLYYGIDLDTLYAFIANTHQGIPNLTFSTRKKAEEYLSQKVILVTEDGVKLKVGDTVYYCWKGKDVIYKGNTVISNEFVKQEGYIYFSTSELAINWEENNKPRFSKKDIEEAINSIEHIKGGIYYYINKFELRKKLGI